MRQGCTLPHLHKKELCIVENCKGLNREISFGISVTKFYKGDDVKCADSKNAFISSKGCYHAE